MIGESHRFLGCLGLSAVLLLCNSATLRRTLAKRKALRGSRTAERVLRTLADGAYQFCTKPEPQDWRDGAGVCLNFLKQGTTIEGYYGLPHSNSYVCLQGQVTDNWLEGKGLIAIWSGNPLEPDAPQEKLNWGQKDRLSLTQGQIVHRDGLNDEQTRWIMFRQARLDMQGMYPYSRPRMTPPTQLCDWHSN